MQDSANDSGGTPITVGATVKLVGVVTAMSLGDNRFNDIEVTLSHPLSASQQSGPPLGITGGDVGPGNRTKINVAPSMLTVGA
jgi:hypothetical protein